MIHDRTITYKEFKNEILNRSVILLTKKLVLNGFPKEVAEPQAEYTANKICENEDNSLRELYDNTISGSITLYEAQRQGLKIVITCFEEKHDLEL